MEEDDLLTAYNPALQRASAVEIEAKRKQGQPSTFAKAAPAAGTILGAIVGGYFGGPAGALEGAKVGGGIGAGAAGIANGVQGKQVAGAVQGGDQLFTGITKLKAMKDRADYQDRVNQPLPPLAEPE